MSREQLRSEHPQGAHDALHHELPEARTSSPTMLGAVASGVGAPVLQRKLAQRLQRRGEATTESTATTNQPVVQRKEVLPTGKDQFSQMWDAHPHNYQADESQNQSSADLLEEQGLPDWIGNTCAVRLSTMLNNMGYTITPEKTKAAGMSRPPTYSKKTKQYYILAASEMWNYISKNFRKADQTFPPAGIYKDAESFQAAYDKEIRPIIAERKGVVAFETIFGYSGTGHVDIFSGEALSDAPNWYPCKRLHLWYSVTP